MLLKESIMPDGLKNIGERRNTKCKNNRHEMSAVSAHLGNLASVKSLTALALFLPCPVFSISSAMPSQVLCNAQYVVVGTVLVAEARDCRTDAKLAGTNISYCQPQDLVNLKVEISEVLGQKNEVLKFPHETGIAKGGTVELVGALHNNVQFPATESYDRIGVIPPSTGPVTNEKVANMFEGRQFIFSVRIYRGDVWANGQIVKDHIDTSPYGTGVWRLSKRDWIVGLLKNSDGSSCSKEITI